MRPIAGRHLARSVGHTGLSSDPHVGAALRARRRGTRVRCDAPRPAHLLSEEPRWRPVAVHTLRATPRHHGYGVPGGAAARHAARDSGHLSGCLVAVRSARSRWSSCATRGALSSPPKEKRSTPGRFLLAPWGRARASTSRAHPVATRAQGRRPLSACGDASHRWAPSRPERRPHRPQQRPSRGCCAPRSSPGHACAV